MAYLLFFSFYILFNFFINLMIPIFPFFYRYYRQEHGIDATRLSQMVEEDLENLGIPKVCNNKAI